jgi:hypothetical protein
LRAKIAKRDRCRQMCPPLAPWGPRFPLAWLNEAPPRRSRACGGRQPPSQALEGRWEIDHSLCWPSTRRRANVSLPSIRHNDMSVNPSLRCPSQAQGTPRAWEGRRELSLSRRLSSNDPNSSLRRPRRRKAPGGVDGIDPHVDPPHHLHRGVHGGQGRWPRT